MKATNVIGLVAATLSAALVSGCGEVARTGRSPVQIVIVSLEAASGAQPDEFGGTLSSDVITNVRRQVGDENIEFPTVFGDVARVTLRLVLKDQGVPGSIASPSVLNAVTINRYRVSYRRSDGRDVQGVDVPYAFDSALTFTVPPDGEVSAGFLIVRNTAKHEAPLAALAGDRVIISTLADVTFYGHDQTGNEISATGTIGIFFGNFGDPQ